MSDEFGGGGFYEDEYEAAADSFPNDLSEEQFIAALEIIEDMLDEGYDWADIYDAIYEDFWEWFRENYG